MTLSVLTVTGTYAYGTYCEEAINSFPLEINLLTPFQAGFSVATPSNATSSNATQSDAEYETELINDL